MPRFRNMNPRQQARVQSQIQTGNYGSGAAGRVAQRRAAMTQPQTPAPMTQDPVAIAPEPQQTQTVDRGAVMGQALGQAQSQAAGVAQEQTMAGGQTCPTCGRPM